MKTIPLTQGQQAIVDDEDFEHFSTFKWYARKSSHTYYACRSSTYGTRKSIMMHRVIMQAKPGQIVDHINQNGLDNRRANLRFVTHAENILNSKHTKGSTGYYGVWMCKSRKKHQACIYINRKAVHIGVYDTPEEAAIAYDMKCIELGRYDKLNFPPEQYRLPSLGIAMLQEL